MPIVQSGSLNTTALVVPDLYVQIVPPQNLVVNGVPTNIVGVVGSSTWGPVNQPVIIGTMADYARSFGPIQARTYDMGTQVATAVQQGAQAFRCVRVTDGTDLAASYPLLQSSAGYPVMLTARYSGSLGNSIVLQIVPGSAVGTWRLTIGLPGQLAESFDNIPGSEQRGALAEPGQCGEPGAGAVAWPQPVVRCEPGDDRQHAAGDDGGADVAERVGRRRRGCCLDPGRFGRLAAAGDVCAAGAGLQPAGAIGRGRFDDVDVAGGVRARGGVLRHPDRAERGQYPEPRLP